MYEHVAVPIPADLFVRLATFLQEQGSARNPVTAVSDAIDYWIENASWKQEIVPGVAGFSSRGYTWKYDDRCLFLPHGTEIRMQHKGQYHYAAVEGDEVRYKGLTMTPGALANAIALGSRNAWLHLWIKRPADKEWTLADRLSPSAKSKALAERADQMLHELTKQEG